MSAPWWPPALPPWYPGNPGGVTFANAPPGNVVAGHFWWNGTILQMWDGIAWQTPIPDAAGVLIQPDAPEGPFRGMMWFDGTTVWVWEGTIWVPFSRQGPDGPVGPEGPAGPQGPVGPLLPDTMLQQNPTFLNGGVIATPTNNTFFTVSPVSCADSAGAVWIRTTVSIQKNIQQAWAPGNSGGAGIGIVPVASTWYHVFAIVNNGNGDVYFDTSVNAVNRPANTTAWRRIGSFKTNAGAVIMPCTQVGDVFSWRPGPGDTINVVSQTLTASPSPGTSSSFANVLVPPAVVTTALMTGTVNLITGSSGEGIQLVLFPTAMGSTVTPLTWAGFATAQASGGTGASCAFTTAVQTDLSQVIGVGYFGSANMQIAICCLGYVDPRGKL